MTSCRRCPIIGLTGPTGAGKGVVSGICRRWGIPSIDTDAVYHALLEPPSACLDGLVASFGTGICNPDGTLNRPALSAIVFAPGAGDKLELLNRITHGFVLDKVRTLCRAQEEAGAPAVLVDAPLLYESGFDRECDRVLAVLAAPDTRLCRIMARDDISLNAALARLRAQKPDDFYARADGILYNDGTPARPADRLGRMPAVRRSVSGRAGGFDLRNPPHAVVVAVILVISLLFGFLFDLACGGIERLRYPRKYRDYVETYASRFSVPEAVLYAVMRTESGFDSAAESSAGAVGLMQLMPDTFLWLTQDVLHEYLEDGMRYDPETSIRYGACLLSRYYLRFGRWELAFAAYNAGETRVDGWLADESIADGTGGLRRIPYRETKHYVSKVQKAVSVYEKLYD